MSIFGVLNNNNNYSTSKTNFVVLSMPRSGSNYLCGLLNSHPDILCHHEVFHRDEIYYSLDHRDGDLNLGTIEERDQYSKKFIRKIWENNFGCSSVGFKIFPNQHKKAINFVINNHKIKKVILKRNNYFRSYTSYILAKKTGIYSNLKKSKSPNHKDKQTKIRVDLDDLDRYIISRNNFFRSVRNRLESTNQSFVEVSYEDLFGGNRISVHQNILNYICVKNSDLLKETHRKQNSSRYLSEIIDNFSDLSEKYQDSDLAEYLLN
ncbi:hypothetical protein XM38_025200 [Halomicronema hongdechloris C2206]|uniref:Uncharacterized protein n=1 Tax=Halomicronema hongdechloris C2206 TaxID=1641165 RepID=A0A1Z3HMP7_9CYAN|nr:hypothetical protein XM38_025200 [Halomicronema hongdechloris C2206]